MSEPQARTCPHCDAAMKRVHTIAHLDGLPEIHIFYCSRCEHLENQVGAGGATSSHQPYGSDGRHRWGGEAARAHDPDRN
jgi:hypothetical protein